MKDSLRKIISRYLRDIADKIESKECELSPEEAMEILDSIAKEPMSKESACSFLGISRTCFDQHIRQGLIPKGVKRRGFKELTWYKCDLEKCIINKKK